MNGIVRVRNDLNFPSVKVIVQSVAYERRKNAKVGESCVRQAEDFQKYVSK